MYSCFGFGCYNYYSFFFLFLIHIFAKGMLTLSVENMTKYQYHHFTNLPRVWCTFFFNYVCNICTHRDIIIPLSPKHFCGRDRGISFLSWFGPININYPIALSCPRNHEILTSEINRFLWIQQLKCVLFRGHYWKFDLITTCIKMIKTALIDRINRHKKKRNEMKWTPNQAPP